MVMHEVLYQLEPGEAIPDSWEFEIEHASFVGVTTVLQVD